MQRFTAIITSIILLAACSPRKPEQAAPSRATTASHMTITTDDRPPIRIAIFVDQSASIHSARVAPVTASDFSVLYDRLAATGGEVAVGMIREESDRPLARLYIPSPPTDVLVGHRPANVFHSAAARKRADAAQAEVAGRQAGWRREVAHRQRVFTRSVETLLGHAADAPATDIGSALLRADVFLAEPNDFRLRTKNVVILVSDGIETVSPSALPRLSAPAQILLVNGAGEIGKLRPLAPLRFESLDAALRYTVADGGTHVRR